MSLVESSPPYEPSQPATYSLSALFNRERSDYTYSINVDTVAYEDLLFAHLEPFEP